MKHDIDTLVADICTSHPELMQAETAVRAIVKELLVNQPVVRVDDVFRARLRQELLRQAGAQFKSKSVVPWWVIYTLPVGVTAILLLVVYPNLEQSPLPPTQMDTMSPESSSLQMNEQATDQMESASLKQGDTGTEASMMATDFFTATFSDDFKSVKVAYAIFSQPGFITLFGPGGVVATSDLIASGEHLDIVIPLNSRIQSQVIYTATLFYDDGDGIFTHESDPMAYDQSGQPVMVQMVAP